MWNSRELRMLANLHRSNTRRFHEFPSNRGEDEFVIIREDGTRQGIFKEWAPPVLPELAGYAVDEWRAAAREQPAFLDKELRRAWRNSWLLDRDMVSQFAAKPLPEDPRKRVTELVGRLVRAFGLMAPFYHLEAIADDPAWLGIGASEGSEPTGALDVTAFLLPSAFQEYVVAEAGNWNGLDWAGVRGFANAALAKPLQARALLGLAGMVGVPPAHLIFAANVLEWISGRVGGKRGDADEQSACEELCGIIAKSRENRHVDCLSALAEVNAKIRFFNWLPLIKGEQNFSGRNWTYASVCDTAADLFEALDASPELWQPDFRETYVEVLRPQLLNLDAASARGRFLLDLIVNEKRLVCEQFNVRPAGTQYRNQCRRLLVHDATHEINQPCMVGTKPVGLALASYVLGTEYVLPGHVIPMDQVRFRRYQGFAEAVRGHGFETRHWAIRSSSLDEGTARGVYETVLKVSARELPRAIRHCIRSHNEPNAVAFRSAHGQSDLDQRVEMAVLVQPYQAGKCGGVAVVNGHPDGKGKQYHVSLSRTADQVTSGEKARELVFSSSQEVPRRLAPLVGVLKRLHDVFGGTLQIEWVISNTNKLIVLQMEFLPTESASSAEHGEGGMQAESMSLGSPEDIDKVVGLFKERKEDRIVRFEIGPEIDPKSFQADVFLMVVRLGRRIKAISLANPVSPSSHFANICRHFGITLLQ